MIKFSLRGPDETFKKRAKLYFSLFLKGKVFPRAIVVLMPALKNGSIRRMLKKIPNTRDWNHTEWAKNKGPLG